MNLIPTITLAKRDMLPDTKVWQYRTEIKSETSDRIYVISQNIAHKHWGCSCMAFRRYRRCKHLISVGLPCNELPYDCKIQLR